MNFRWSKESSDILGFILRHPVSHHPPRLEQQLRDTSSQKNLVLE